MLQRPLFRYAAAVVAAVIAFVVIGFLVVKLAEWLAATDGLTGKERAEEIGRMRTTLLAVLAGVIATIGAIYTARSYELNRRGHALDRQGQITERFTRAIDQLGSAELDVRLGGIYALERLARDSPDDHGPIMEVLTAYVREHAHWPPESSNHDTYVAPATDVQAVVTVLGRRIAAHDARALDLRSVDLRAANLREATLREANLFGANLRAADFRDADLRDAVLTGANLRGAVLARANLQGTRLDAYLEGADLRGANLQDADLEGATYDTTTRWPAGMTAADAEKRGVRQDDQATTEN